MRVISGVFRGRKLAAPSTHDTRPVTDRVKESVFSSLGSFVVDAVVADLYAGAGSFGIEALSRGARSVSFVERGRQAVEALKANLASLGVADRGMDAEVAAIDVGRFLDGEVGPFDLVFCDPPWSLASDELERMLDRLRPQLESGALVVVTRRASDPVPVPFGFETDDERRFGDTRIIRYRKEDG